MSQILASIFVPVPAYSEMNKGHEHWAKKKQRWDEQKNHTKTLLLRDIGRDGFCRLVANLPLLVRMTVLAIQTLDDDNLTSSVKYYRDEVARFLGVDDGDSSVRYTVGWKRWKGKGHKGVQIDFMPLSVFLTEEKARIEAELALLAGEKR